MSNTQAPRRLGWLAGIGLIGTVLGSLLTIHYYQLRSGTAGFKSVCNMGETVNCDAVALSSFADLLPGVPLSSFVAGWFLAFTLVALIARGPTWRNEAIRCLFAMSLVSVLGSVIYFAIMATVLHSFCLYCLFVDGVSLVSFGLALSLKPQSFRSLKLDMGMWKTFAGIVAGCMFVAVVAFKGLEGEKMAKGTLAVLVDEVVAAAPVAVKTGDEYPSIGPKDAPIVIAEFSDFQCPFCRIGAMTLKSVANRYVGQVRIVFKNYPLNSTCNPASKHNAHPAACEAAKVAYCAHQQGKFEPVYEALFEKQESITHGKPRQFGIEAGLDAAKLDECLASEQTQNAIARDGTEGEQLGVRSTPTFFINGRKVEGAYPVEGWIQIIERLPK